uniref:Amyloid beta protein binding family A member 1 n=1 Tax=Paramormyrops kingsleyae TaxID=1676925 RepID=A0A3B3R9L8_9TELE
MNHLNEAEREAEPGSGSLEQSEAVEAEMGEVEAELPPPAPPPLEREDPEEDEGASGLARSGSTESGFHNHTDRAEGDAVMALEPEREDDGVYGVPFRPEAEGYTESAEAEQHQPHQQPHYLPQPPPLPLEPLPNAERPLSRDAEALNPTYSSYVYAQQPYQAGEAGGAGEPEDEPYSEPYASYGMQEHVYEEIGDGPPADGETEKERMQQRRAGFRLFEQEDFRQQEAVGSRLHHYDERSDGESDSPEKEAEFAPYPRMDSMDQEEDIDQIVAEVKESLSSQSLDRMGAAEEWPESEHNSQEEPEERKPPADEEEVHGPTAASPSEDPAPQREGREKRDAISLAIKDIKEAIEEVKTRTVRSPYTPDEPKEPIWVMRQDLSPTSEGELQPPPGVDVSISERRSHTLKSRKSLASFPTYVEVPGPCDPEDLIDGIIFAANYLGSTQLLSDKTPSKNVRMMQAQEAVSRIKVRLRLLESPRGSSAPEGEAQPMTEVDLFISTQRIKVLNADSQVYCSYIPSYGNISTTSANRSTSPQQNKRNTTNCNIFLCKYAQLIAQSIGQAFSVAYQEFLRANGINPEDLSQKEYSDLLNTQDMYNDDLIHFSKSENCKDVYIEKQKGDILGVVIVESGWGSILPTVIIASMMHAGPAEKSGRINIGDQIMSINGTSLVGLPLSTCQSIIKGLKNQSRIKLNIVRCPPVTTVLIRRPDLRYQLGFSVQNGIICSLMRGGIAERGGVRVGHRIIEINGQSVVATPHEKIVHILSNAVGEIHMKTMPAAMYRLLTAQEQPVYI